MFRTACNGSPAPENAHSFVAIRQSFVCSRQDVCYRVVREMALKVGQDTAGTRIFEDTLDAGPGGGFLALAECHHRAERLRCITAAGK
jgi:hypothetical protein